MNTHTTIYALLTILSLGMSTISRTENMLEDMIAMQYGNDALPAIGITPGIKKAALVGVGCGCAVLAFRRYKSIKAAIEVVRQATERIEATQVNHTNMLNDLKTNIADVITTQGQHSTALNAIETHQTTLFETMVQQHGYVQKSLADINQSMGGIKNAVDAMEQRITTIHGDIGTLTRAQIQMQTTAQETHTAVHEVLKQVKVHRKETKEGAHVINENIDTLSKGLGLYGRFYNFMDKVAHGPTNHLPY